MSHGACPRGMLYATWLCIEWIGWTGVEKGSPAADAQPEGLRVGEIILKVNDVQVEDTKALQAQLRLQKPGVDYKLTLGPAVIREVWVPCREAAPAKIQPALHVLPMR